MTPPDRRVDGWLLSAVFAVLLALYSSTVLSFYNVFSEEGSDQSHAPLLLLVVLYLIYRTWVQAGRQVSIRFNRLAMVLLAALSLLWLVLGLVFVEAGQQAVLIVMIAMLVVGMLGLRDGAKYIMPVLLLLTVVPVWSPVIPYLQAVSAQTTAYLLDLAGITSTREGYLLIIPNGTFEVADACSGLKFQIVGITLALIHTQLIRVPARVVLTYVLLASLLALVSNVLRIFIVVVIGYHYGMTHEYVQDHNFIGWMLFSIFFFLLLFFGERRLRGHMVADPAEEGERPSGAIMAPWKSGVAMIVLALSVGPVLYGYFIHRGASSDRDHISVLKQIPGWALASTRLTDWAPVWTRGEHSFEGSFSSDGERVDLFATEFTWQRQGYEAVNTSHQVYDMGKWSRISRSAKVVDVPGNGELTVEVTLLKSPSQRKRLVWQWYRTNDKIVASTAQAKLNNLIGVIAGKPEISVFVASKEIVRNEAHATDVLERFLSAYLGLFKDRS